MESLKTGGGKNQAQALDDVEEKIKGIIQLSVEGMASIFDCDNDNDVIGNIILCSYDYLPYLGLYFKKGCYIKLNRKHYIVFMNHFD